MLPHDRESYRQQMGHVWLGFADEQINACCCDAGFTRVRVVPLAAGRENQRTGIVRRDMNKATKARSTKTHSGVFSCLRASWQTN